ncbi:hypothetical protein CGMCC3_g16398 [Colletotrichum fructicola]|nr:uncharacterized protein CGMCC3_g16398 [Colletotrichum fructicola]KAE9567434.1 hypothetical protein CGMCC3_g16398 [Colletotrichum fructicola]
MMAPLNTGPQLVGWSAQEQAGIGRPSTPYAAKLAFKLESEKGDQTLETFKKLVHTLGARRSQLP